MDKWHQYYIVDFPSILNSPYIQLSTIDKPVSIFGNIVQVYSDKHYPKVGENISIYHIFQTLPQHNNIYCVQNFVLNIISDHFILPSSTNCLKQIIKHNIILGIDIPSSQVLEVFYQGIILVIKIQHFPSRDQRFHLGTFFPYCSLTSSTKTGQPHTLQQIR